MPKSIEAEGVTVDEAIQNALNALGLGRDSVEIEIVHAQSPMPLLFLSSPPRLFLTPPPAGGDVPWSAAFGLSLPVP